MHYNLATLIAVLSGFAFYFICKGRIRKKTHRKAFSEWNDLRGYQLSRNYERLYDLIIKDCRLTIPVWYKVGLTEHRGHEYHIGYSTMCGGAVTVFHGNAKLFFCHHDKAEFIDLCINNSVVIMQPDKWYL